MDRRRFLQLAVALGGLSATTGANWANVKALTGAASAEGDIQFYFGA